MYTRLCFESLCIMYHMYMYTKTRANRQMASYWDIFGYV